MSPNCCREGDVVSQGMIKDQFDSQKNIKGSRPKDHGSSAKGYSNSAKYYGSSAEDSGSSAKDQ